MAMLHVDTTTKDIGEPANVRAYLVASITARRWRPQHRLLPAGAQLLVGNPVLRALLVAMDEWVTSDTEPPASQLPRSADGTLVTSEQGKVGYPAIPGVTYNGRMHTGDLWDFGPDFDKGILSTLPPRLVGTPYPALVPKTDGDGNDVAGIRLPDVAVPIATYNGWEASARPATAAIISARSSRLPKPRQNGSRPTIHDCRSRSATPATWTTRRPSPTPQRR